VGFVRAPGAREAFFAAVKRLFDVLFLLETAPLGLGILAAFTGRLSRRGEEARPLGGLVLAMGASQPWAAR
jgi:hypothetical protein